VIESTFSFLCLSLVVLGREKQVNKYPLSEPGISWKNSEVIRETVLPLAQKAANIALNKCGEGKYKVSVAVVD
jgi:hypothetical protein